MVDATEEDVCSSEEVICVEEPISPDGLSSGHLSSASIVRYLD